MISAPSIIHDRGEGEASTMKNVKEVWGGSEELMEVVKDEQRLL
jgi:hypothetical protein